MIKITVTGTLVEQLEKLTVLDQQLNALLKGAPEMATVQQLKDAVAAEAAEVKARVDALQAEVQALKDQVAAGGTVTEAQLDEVLTGIQGIFTAA